MHRQTQAVMEDSSVILPSAFESVTLRPPINKLKRLQRKIIVKMKNYCQMKNYCLDNNFCPDNNF